MAGSKQAFLHPGVRHLKKILGFQENLAALAGLPPEAVATEKGLLAAMRIVVETQPAPDAAAPIKLTAELVPSERLRRGIKINNDVVDAIARGSAPDPLAIISEVIGHAYPHTTPATRGHLEVTWASVMNQLSLLKGFEGINGQKRFRRHLNSEEIQPIVDNLRGDSFANEHTNNTPFTRKWIRSFQKQIASETRYRLASRDDAIRLSHAALAISGKIPVEITDASQDKIRRAKKITGVSLPFKRSTFRDGRVEALAKALEDTVRTKLSPFTALGTDKDPFKAALVIPYISADGTYCLGACFTQKNGSEKILFKSYAISNKSLGSLEFGENGDQIAATIFVKGVDRETPDWLSPQHLTSVDESDRVSQQDRADTSSHFYSVLNKLHPEIAKLSAGQHGSLFPNAAYKFVKSPFIEGLIRLQDSHARYAYARFRRSLSDLDNALIGKHLKVDGHFTRKSKRNAMSTARIWNAMACVMPLTNRAWIAQAMTSAPLLTNLFARDYETGEQKGTEGLRLISTGAPLTEVAKIALTSCYNNDPEMVAHLQTKTLKTALKLPADAWRHTPLDDTLQRVDNYYKANRFHPYLSATEVIAIASISCQTPTCLIRSNPVSASAYINAFREAKDGHIVKLSMEVEDTIRYFDTTIGQIVPNDPETSPSERKKTIANALEHIIAPPGRSYAGIERLSEQWHHSSNHLERSLDAYTDELKDADIRNQLGSNRDNHLLDSYPVPIQDTKTIDGIKILPLTTKEQFFAESEAMDHCVSSYRNDAKYGRLLILSVSSQEGRSTAGYHFYPGDHDRRNWTPDGPRFERFQHTSNHNDEAPFNHIRAADDYIKSIVKDWTLLSRYNSKIVTLRELESQTTGALSPDSAQKLEDFRFEQLKEFLGKDERHLNREEWLQKINADAAARAARADQRATRSAQRPQRTQECEHAM